MKIWPEVALVSRCEIFSGYPFKSAQFTEDPDDVALVKGENVGQGEILWEISKRWPREDAEDLVRYRLEPDDVVLAMDRPWVPAGLKFARIRASDPKALLVQRVARLRAFDGLDQNFLHYVIGSPEFVAYIKNIGRGVGVPHISGKQIGEYLLRLPPPQVQRSIAEILSAYDELIENNRRRMALLEEAARQLYREWFVRLRFPGHEHTRITNGVPKGWERKPVEELTTFLNRGIAPQYNDDADGLVINQKCIRGGRLDLTLARHQSREFKPDRQIQPGDVLVNSTGEGTLGRVARVLAPVANCTVDTHVTIVRPITAIGSHYFGHALMEWEPRFSTMGRGATNQTELSRNQIGAAEILVPSRSLVKQFEESSEPVFRHVANLIAQNEKLRAARDLLLPRLISGEIAV